MPLVIDDWLQSFPSSNTVMSGVPRTYTLSEGVQRTCWTMAKSSGSFTRRHWFWDWDEDTHAVTQTKVWLDRPGTGTNSQRGPFIFMEMANGVVIGYMTWVRPYLIGVSGPRSRVEFIALKPDDLVNYSSESVGSPGVLAAEGWEVSRPYYGWTSGSSTQYTYERHSLTPTGYHHARVNKISATEFIVLSMWKNPETDNAYGFFEPDCTFDVRKVTWNGSSFTKSEPQKSIFVESEFATYISQPVLSGNVLKYWVHRENCVTYPDDDAFMILTVDIDTLDISIAEASNLKEFTNEFETKALVEETNASSTVSQYIAGSKAVANITQASYTINRDLNAFVKTNSPKRLWISNDWDETSGTSVWTQEQLRWIITSFAYNSSPTLKKYYLKLQGNAATPSGYTNYYPQTFGVDVKQVGLNYWQYTGINVDVGAYTTFTYPSGLGSFTNVEKIRFRLPTLYMIDGNGQNKVCLTPGYWGSTTQGDLTAPGPHVDYETVMSGVITGPTTLKAVYPDPEVTYEFGYFLDDALAGYIRVKNNKIDQEYELYSAINSVNPVIPPWSLYPFGHANWGFEDILYYIQYHTYTYSTQYAWIIPWSLRAEDAEYPDTEHIPLKLNQRDDGLGRTAGGPGRLGYYGFNGRHGPRLGSAW